MKTENKYSAVLGFCLGMFFLLFFSLFLMAKDTMRSHKRLLMNRALKEQEILKLAQRTCKNKITYLGWSSTEFEVRC